MKWTTRCLLSFVGVTIAISSQASAEIWSIHTRSNNIHCTLGDQPGKTEMWCVLFRISGPPALPKPDDCSATWGHGYFISDRGSVEMTCMEKPTNDGWRGTSKFEKNKPTELGGVTCTATRSKLSCMNLDGHGFSLSRRSQSVF
ncbi:DUF6636 domain-containing protein [uncultured Litoreibacter sp.]|uniref:DUF6636 domain-containing protein n=1 Tax=uncultured Litoreibacter sp. TaxID=1392394 RepID=UPI00345B383E